MIFMKILNHTIERSELFQKISEKGLVDLEIYDRQEKGFIEVWMTKEEQQKYDRKELTHLILEQKQAGKKCKVAFLLSGEDDLFDCTESLLTMNL